jgi:hypothetical protein
MALAQNRYEDQWNRREDHRIDMKPHNLFLTKTPKTYDGEKTAFSIDVVGKSG